MSHSCSPARHASGPETSHAEAVDVEAGRDARAALRLQGARIHLRPVTLSDVNQNYQRWMNDTEIRRYLESRFERHTAEGLRAYVAEKQKDPSILFLAIVLNHGNRHIGNIKLGPIDRRHRLGDIGIMIGEKDCWGQGHAAEAIRLLADYALGPLQLHKVTASCYSVNPGSAKAFENAGFVVEGIRREHCFCEGRYVDVLLLGKLGVAATGSS